MKVQTNRAWRGLVDYANGVATGAGELRRLLADCMPWITAIEPFGLLDFSSDDDIEQRGMDYRPAVESLLRWLCSEPGSTERKSLSSPALGFLREHGPHIRGMNLKEVCYDSEYLQKLNYTPGELETFREQHARIYAAAQYRTRKGELKGTDFSPFGILVPSKDYEDFADPICDFLLSEYQRYSTREYNRRDKRPVPLVPIFVCPACNNLVMPERTGRKKFCSACSSKARTRKYLQGASPDENRDYQWLYRLLIGGDDLRIMRLRNAKNRERLREIKVRQGTSSRCQNLMQKMRL